MLKRIFFILLMSIFLFINNLYAKNRVILKVFHAGSLCVPFSKIEKAFEQKYPYIDVRREASGSVKAIRKVIELNKSCDVIAVADYSLIPKMLFGSYTDYVKLFARNELVLCYTKDSRYAHIINKDNWYKVFEKKDVKWGFSNPNDDPCGYRTVIALGLASIYYKDNLILKNLLAKYTNIIFKQTKVGFNFVVPKYINTKGNKLVIRHKSVELLGLLESGAIDYAFEYKSVALQHRLLFLELPPQLNLGSLEYADFYKKSRITLFNGKKVIGKPIVYGITTLKTSHHLKEAKLFEDFVISKRGRDILYECNQTPIFPVKVVSSKK